MDETTLPLDGGDESGADTFARYRYQAKITLLQWFRTVLEDGPLAVYAEHIEDLVIDFGARQEFVQVKSRAEGRPLWRASEMCDEHGGIDSLARVHSIAKGVVCTYELYLEGASSPSAETKTFVDNCNDASEALRKKIGAHLKKVGLGQDSLETFLSRLRIRPKLPSQSVVDSVCMKALLYLAPSLTGHALILLCEKLLQIVEHAQEAKHPGLAPDASGLEFLRAHLGSILQLQSDEDDRSLSEAKSLTAGRLTGLLPAAPTSEGLLLLRRTVEGSRTSALERKLEGAGATPGVIETAKALRAMSDTRRIELFAGPENLVERLEDLDSRLLVHAQAVALGFLGEEASANGIWRELITSVGVENIDRFELFQRDRHALVGLLCCISDECRFNWRAS